MKTNETQEKVLDFISKFSDTSAESIIGGTGIFKLQVFKALKALTENEQISINKESDPPTYKSTHQKDTKQKVAPTKQEVTSDIEPDEITLAKVGGRDTSKLKFQGQEYGKGQLVLAVFRAVVEKSPKISLEKLKTLFPKELQPRYGTVEEISKARKLSEGRDRFFFKPEQILLVAGTGGKKVKAVVSNQWSSTNIKPFIKTAKSLGYIIK